jgi:HEAT repeat protein
MVPLLTAAVLDPNPQVRARACACLEILGPKAATASAVLTRALADEDENVRGCAADALAVIGPAARPAVPHLVEAAGDQDPLMRCRAVMALAAIGAADDGVVAALATALDDPMVEVAQAAVHALKAVGHDAEARRTLGRAVTQEQVWVRLAAAEALGGLGDGGVSVLRPLLRDRRAEVRHAAAVGLALAGDSSAEATTAWFAALRDRDGEVRLHAARAAGSLRPTGEVTAALLRLLRHDPVPQVRLEVVTVLRQLGEPTREAVEALRELVRDDPGPSALRDAPVKTLEAILPP